MKIGSLFSGIGGLELGLERSIPGAHTVFQVEQDPYARAVLAKHWPNVKRYEDVRQVGAHNLPACDLLCGGFPCQDLSIAGKGAGLDGARSGLWTEYARIIRELRPRFVVVENVTALLNGGMGRVLGDLAACGYDAIWDCIPAAAVGAPHRRDRLFLVAYTNGGSVHAKQELRQKCSCPVESIRHGHTQRVVNTNPWRSAVHKSRHWEVSAGVDRVVDGAGSWLERHRAIGNAVVPQVAEVVGRVVLQLAGGAP
tara:strand:+ start:69 stop:830 length:762 start_codon:yes stop_codon:yes gene_type:complete